jgi:4-aminobutyrate aminotransferase-like enzyme
MSGTREINDKHKRYIFDAVFNYYETPLPLQRGRGVHLYDFDGNEYLDFFAGIVTVNVGHCHPRVTAAIREQAETLQHVSTLYPTAPIVELAEKLAQITPGELSKTYFTNSGTEANETAVLLAQLATGAQSIVALRHSYSGRSSVARSLSGQSPWKMQPNQIAAVVHAPAPYCYRCPFKLSYPDCGVACAEDLEELIATTTPGVVAGFLAETVLGAGGYIVPPPEYFPIAVDIIRRHGGLFIADEVQSGFGRTGGKWFGIEHWGVEPDVITMAKGIANGAPLGATVTRPELADDFGGGLSISTFGGNPMSSVASLASIAVIEEDGLLDNAATVGAHLRDRLDELAGRFEVIGDVRGMGLMQGIELVTDRSTKEPAAQVALRLMEETKARGLLIGKGGLYGNVLRIGPPLNITVEQIDEGIEKLADSFAALG